MKYGKNLKWFLSEVANAEPEQYETGSIEILGENEKGEEGSCEVEISHLMTTACDRIAELENALTQVIILAERETEFANKRTDVAARAKENI